MERRKFTLLFLDLFSKTTIIALNSILSIILALIMDGNSLLPMTKARNSLLTSNIVKETIS